MIRPSLPTLFLAYLKIGCTAFGGGLAALPIFRTELATRRAWLSETTVDELFATAQAIPGVILVNTAVLTALPLRRRPGAVLASIAVVLPAFLLILLLGTWLLAHRDAPWLTSLWFGLRPAVVGLLLATALRLLRTHVRRLAQALLAAAAFVYLLFRPSPLPVLLAAILMPPLLRRLRSRRLPPPPPAAQSTPGSHAPPPPPFMPALAATGPLLLPALLFLTFFKISLFSIGGGYNMIPLMQHELAAHDWLQPADFLDLFALSEATPGPVAVNAATLAGAKVAGPWGALAATTGACLPGFLVALFAGAWILAHREHPDIAAILRTLPPLLAGLILATAWRLFSALQLAASPHPCFQVVLLLLVALACFLRPRLSPVVPLACCALLSFGLTTLFP